MQSDILTAIKNRRSIRKYTSDDIPRESLGKVLEAGRWAPSGLNNQPWKFAIIKEAGVREKLSRLTKYSRIVSESNTCIAVFYHVPSGYNRDKDILSIGACIQNMLLAADSFGIGSVWLGEILNRKDEVNSLLGIDNDNELMAVIALGFPDESPKGSRNGLDAFILKSY